MSIVWNKVTWYSKLAAVIIFGLTFYVGFVLGNLQQQIRDTNSATKALTESSAISVPVATPATIHSTLPPIVIGDPKDKGTLEGVMTIGPICPVERLDKPCKPTPEMYFTHKVFVYNTDKTKVIATLTPDAQGKFHTMLPVGPYMIDVEHQAVGFVRGVPAKVQIALNKTTTIVIEVDTGIR